MRKLILFLMLLLATPLVFSAENKDQDFHEKFVAGNVTLTCSNIFCAGRFGANRDDLITLVSTESWEELAKKTAEINYKHQMAYYYLAKAAIRLGYYDAASAYITKAGDPSINRLCLLGSCEGIDLEAELGKFNSEIMQVKSGAVKPNDSVILQAKRDEMPRIALVIGNSHYQQLGTLSNTLNDAKAIEKTLVEIGYKTTLVSDANEASLRKEIKKFANDSEVASIAVIFYAGHGAQVNGENFILPVDMEVPRRESDIQLSALKVDDIVNAVKSKVRVVFLDACRDNPVLIKSLSKGRGSYRGGLAPANTTPFEGSEGGIFIAYATDAGNVALDGEGQRNSPFTQALLKYIKSPTSIDDMFSMVTRDVRDSTKNSQRPYKYASLDGVFCLTGECSSSQFASSAFEDANSQIDNNVSRKVTKLPSSGKEADKWVIVNYGTEKDNELILYIDLNSIKKIDKRTVAKIKFEDHKGDKTSSKNMDNNYTIQYWVSECDKDVVDAYGIYRSIEYNALTKKSKDVLWGSPSSIPFNFKITPDNKSFVAQTYPLICNPSKLTPIVPSELIQSDDWERLFTLDADKGIDLFYLKSSVKKVGGSAEVIIKLHNAEPSSITNAVFFAGAIFRTNLMFSDVVLKDKFSCDKKSYSILGENYLDIEGKVIAISFYSEEFHKIVYDISKDSLGLLELQKIVCGAQ